VIEPGALLAWSALALIVTLTPGADTLLVASHGARGGVRRGLAAVSGIIASIAIWYGGLIAFGALSVLVAVPMLFLAVKIVGAVYLAYLGLGMIWGAIRPATAPPPAVAADGAGTRGAFAQGFLTNALNPKVALFYLAALPQFTGDGANAPLIGVVLIAIHALFGVAWLSFVALAASRARRIAWNSVFVRWLEGAVGAFFVGVAGRLALAQR
jgi:threonine/homoserine/homoserine lactone efflux protein